LKKVVIIGAGISGLTCGFHLAEAGYKVTILEKESVLGGLASSFVINDKWLPMAYHHVMLPEKSTLGYISKFNFFNQLRWVKSGQAFWYDNKSYLLSRPQHIFGFKPLDFKSKLRLFYLGLYVWLRKNWHNLEGRDCDEWLSKMIGKKSAELLFQNLMDIKFGMSSSSISAAWLGERMHRSVRNGERYGRIECGWQALINSIGEKITDYQGEIRSNFEVNRIEANAVRGINKEGGTESFDSDLAVSTVPPPVLNNLLAGSNKNKELLEKIKYKSFIGFVCSSAQEISRNYWSVVLKPRLIFGGFFNHNALLPQAEAGGSYIYYFFTYLEDDDPLFQIEDKKLQELYLSDIKQMFPDFNVHWSRIFKLRFAQPVFRRDYINPPIEITDNMYLAGVYRQFPKPRAMDSAFYSGFETARYIIDKYK
jgi:protoporphyrinogen oxidase